MVSPPAGDDGCPLGKTPPVPRPVVRLRSLAGRDAEILQCGIRRGELGLDAGDRALRLRNLLLSVVHGLLAWDHRVGRVRLRVGADQNGKTQDGATCDEALDVELAWRSHSGVPSSGGRQYAVFWGPACALSTLDDNHLSSQ